MNTSNNLVLFLAFLAMVLSVVTIIYVNRVPPPEAMVADLETNATTTPLDEVSSPRLRAVYKKTTKLPGSLYAGLNYGTPVLRRITASQSMIDLFADLMDSNSVSPSVGGDAVFSLYDAPSREVVEKFNELAVRAASSTIGPASPLGTSPSTPVSEVVTVVQNTPHTSFGRYVLYAFLDKGVDWGEDMVDYCDSTTGKCVYSDVYRV